MTAMKNSKGLFISADLNVPVKAVNIPDRSTIDGLVGGYSERTTYDFDSSFWVNEVGRNQGLPLNQRATDYIRNHSDAAEQGRMVDAPADYGLYGDAVMTGTGTDGEILDLPDRQRDYFMAPAQQAEETPEVEIEEFVETEGFSHDFTH